MTAAATTASPARSDRAEWLRKAAKSRWAVPAVIGIVVLFTIVGSTAKALTAGPSKEEVAQAAAVGAQRGAQALIPETTTPAAGPQYFDYLGPLLAYPITEEARSIITFEAGTSNLNMVNSQAVARQVLALGTVDQCRLTLGIEEREDQNRTTYRARVVYPPQPDGSPKAGKVPLVVCSTSAGTTGAIPSVTSTTGGAG